MRVLGIDPGSRATGYGVVAQEGPRLERVAGGVIRVGEGELTRRLAAIAAALEAVLLETRPDCVALEAVFSARNPRSALLLGQARGAALVACGRVGLAGAEYSPAEVKRAVTGHGGADKAQVQRMVRRLLGLAEAPASDEADALAVAICHAHVHASPLVPARPPRSRSGTRRRWSAR
ncbi:MAG: crossover junction endodeoxyribonuclease RuvC [Myxococcota bacterium]